MGGEWDKLLIGNLGRVVTGKTPPTKNEDNFGGYVPFITPSDMDGRKVISETQRYLTETGADSVGSARIPKGGVMVSCIGSDMGKAAIAGTDAVTNQQINTVVVDDCFSDEFVYYNFSNRKQEFMHLAAGGSAQPILNKGHFSKLDINLPPLPEQKAIAGILGALDDKIDLNRRMNETLESMARAIFKSWFVDFDPVRAKMDGQEPAGMNPETAALFPDSFEDSELGQIPKGWKVVSLADLMEIKGGTQPPKSEWVDEPKEGYVRMIQIRDYDTDSHICFVSDTKKLRKTTREDIMIARYGASVGRILWGMEGTYNVALVRCDYKRPEYREFLRTYLYSYDFQGPLLLMSNRSVQAGFNKCDIASFKLSIPDTPEALRAYQKVAWGLREQIIYNRGESQTLANLRDTLLPKLLSGELRVPEAEKQVEEVV